MHKSIRINSNSTEHEWDKEFLKETWLTREVVGEKSCASRTSWSKERRIGKKNLISFYLNSNDEN